MGKKPLTFLSSLPAVSPRASHQLKPTRDTSAMQSSGVSLLGHRAGDQWENKRRKKRPRGRPSRRDRQRETEPGGECVSEGVRKGSVCLSGGGGAEPKSASSASPRIDWAVKLAGCRDASVCGESHAFCSWLLGRAAEPGVLCPAPRPLPRYSDPGDWHLPWM